MELENVVWIFFLRCNRYNLSWKFFPTSKADKGTLELGENARVTIGWYSFVFVVELFFVFLSIVAKDSSWSFWKGVDNSILLFSWSISWGFSKNIGFFLSFVLDVASREKAFGYLAWKSTRWFIIFGSLGARKIFGNLKDRTSVLHRKTRKTAKN